MCLPPLLKLFFSTGPVSSCAGLVWSLSSTSDWGLVTALGYSALPGLFHPRAGIIYGPAGSLLASARSLLAAKKLNFSSRNPVCFRHVLPAALRLPILCKCRCLCTSPGVGLAPRHRITAIRSEAFILPFCFLSYREKHSLNSN